MITVNNKRQLHSRREWKEKLRMKLNRAQSFVHILFMMYVAQWNVCMHWHYLLSIVFIKETHRRHIILAFLWHSSVISLFYVLCIYACICCYIFLPSFHSFPSKRDVCILQNNLYYISSFFFFSQPRSVFSIFESDLMLSLLVYVMNPDDWSVCCIFIVFGVLAHGTL